MNFENVVFQMRFNIFQEGLFRLAKLGGTTLNYYLFVAPPTPPKVAEKTKAFDLPSHINEQSDLEAIKRNSPVQLNRAFLVSSPSPVLKVINEQFRMSKFYYTL